MHTINRDNYETWLMLYLDNELAASERQAVEAFCSTNPDVQEELDGLKEVMLQPDLPVAMPGKERLLMPELWNEEALTRQQQQLLLLADKELPSEEKAMFELEIETNPLLKKEWNVLKSTILEASEPLEMPEKDSLYKREKSQVFHIGRILRFAAAATILGFGWFFAARFIQPSEITPPGNSTAVVTPKNNQVMVPEVKPTENDSIGAIKANKESVIRDLATVEIKKHEGANEYTIQGIKVIEIPGPTSQNSHNQKEQAANAGLQDVALENTVRYPVEKMERVSFIDIEGVESPSINPAGSVTLGSVAQLATEEKELIETQVINTSELEEEESISIAGARISKQKIRSLYRNITRPLAKTMEKDNGNRIDVK